MAVVFTIYYKPDGTIISYQEGGLVPPKEEIPKGCERVCFDKLVNIFDEKMMINMKVDPKTKQLMALNPANILDDA